MASGVAPTGHSSQLGDACSEVANFMVTATHLRYSKRCRDQALSDERSSEFSVMPSPIVPPFTAESAAKKVQVAEDLWNTRDPERVAMAYTVDSDWRNRAEHLSGREQIKA